MRDGRDSHRNVLNTQSARHRTKTVFSWLAGRPPYYWRLVAIGLLTPLFVVALFQASLVVDGTRYFWLDDDQMISMRYARNLAEGSGLVWNPGERVEGYTNFLWTLVMAGVHLLPVGDAKTAVVLKMINLALAIAVLFLSERLLRLFQPQPGLALPALLITLALCIDLLFWSVNGFETTLLTATFLSVVIRILEESQTARAATSTYLLMGLLPLIRSDAYYVWAAAALLAIGMSHNRRQTAGLLAVSLVLPSLHLLFRHWYYGDWLPNTYYLKVVGVPRRTVSGLLYLARFVRNYGVVLALATLGGLLRGDRRHWLLMGGLAISGCYVLVVGGDAFTFSRYLAHIVPVFLVLAIAAVTDITERGSTPQFPLLLVLFLSVFFQAGVYRPGLLQDLNGAPQSGLVSGLLTRRFTRPEAKIAVGAAGNAPYFSHRYAIDMLGKSDPHIARRQPCPNGIIGHNKFDVSYSLSVHPDLVVTTWPYKLAMLPDAVLDIWVREGCGLGRTLLRYPAFQQEYRSNPVNLPYLSNHGLIFIRSSSAELLTKELWEEPEVSK